MKQPVTVIKRDPAGKEMVRYQGFIYHRDPTSFVLEARFSRADMPFMGTILKRGDRFVETFYTDRWYNIFEIHDREDDRLKGWYCNIGRPAHLEAVNILSYVDLALDLWISPHGQQMVLDEDEFAALNLDAETRSKARKALVELQALFSEKKNPGP